MTTPEKILQQYWGYTDFRPPQKKIINTVMQQKDTVAVLPTGGGKSIIYQVAGLTLGGISLVISPLIALIEDQVNNLQNKGIKAVGLTGNLSFKEQERLLDNVQYGGGKFIYLSPERLQNQYILNRLANMPVQLIAIDEAHCISEWGHDFRPAYLKLDLLREVFPETPVLALTATAKNRVIDDIINYLKLHKPVVFKQSVFRKNIAYKVIIENEKLHYIGQNLNKNETAVIYVNTRKQTYKYAEYLSQLGFATGYFHGGLNLEQKQQMLNDWLQNKTRIMVATTAFGMGIDKPDVRKVYHFNLPLSIENYIQESGRAGRDGQMSEAILLVSSDEIKYFQQKIDRLLPPVKTIHKVYKALYNHFYIGEGGGKDALHNLDFYRFCQRFKLDCRQSLQSIQILDSEGIIKYIETKKYYHSLQILPTPVQIRHYIENRRYGYRLLDHLVRNHTEILHLNTKIFPEKIARKTEIPYNRILQTLKELHNRKIINYQASGDYQQILFLKPRDEYIFKQHQKNIQKRLDLKKEQLRWVWQYANNTQQCRSRLLATYFEEKKTENCGICDICLQQKNKPDENETIRKILELLQNNCLNKHELSKHFSTPIDKTLDFLLEQKKIIFTAQFKYCLAG